MKTFLALFTFSVVFIFIPVAYGQIIENNDTTVIQESHDSLPTSDRSQCIPPCRKGFFCNEGRCISKCNPPCPDGMDCWDDAECHPRAKTIENALNKIDQISKVTTEDELVQGTVVRTNIKNTRVRILDKTFDCNGKLFLNAPKGKYDVHVDAPHYFVNVEDLEVRTGTIDTLTVKLRPFQINVGIAFGVSSMKEFSLLAGEANIGFGLLTFGYIGITGIYVGPLDDESTRLTNYENSYIPDTVKEVWTELKGMGVSLGYIGINPIAHIIKIIPQISFGYWKYDDQTYFQNKFKNGKTVYLDDLEQHDIEKYYMRPTLDFRIGEKVFNFDGRVSVYIGTGTPIVTFLAGFQIAVPR